MKKYSQIVKETTTLNEMSPKKEREVYHALLGQVATGGKHSKKKDIKLLQKLTKKVLKPTGYLGIRQEYKEGNLFQVGDIVETNDGRTAEIIHLGTNYLTLVSEGIEFKKWLNEVAVKENAQPAKFEVSEQIEYKGFVTKYFNESHIETFKPILENEDQYAVLNCLKTVDSLLGMDNLNLWFENYRIDFDRAVKYLAKFDISTEIISEAEDRLLEHALLENVRFSAADKSKVAKIIATTFGETDHSGEHHEVINRAAKKFKTGRHTPEAWKIGGAMLNKATEAGIKWDKNIFHKSIHKAMGLK